ncbi:MAG: AsmA-like C-terminal region-containing protein [Pseudomonadota bacterium]
MTENERPENRGAAQICLRWCWLGVEALAGAAALAIALVLLAGWRISHAPLHFDALSDHVARTIERRLPEGFHVELDGLSLQSGRGRDGAEILIEGLSIDDASGDAAVRAERAAIRLSVRDLLARKPDPVVVAIYGSEVRIVRDETGRITLGADTGFAMSARAMRGTGGDNRLIFLLRASSLERVRIEDARLVFEDRRSGRIVSAPSVDATVFRNGEDVRAEWSGEILSNGGRSPFSGRSDTRADTGETRLAFQLENVSSSNTLALLFGEAAERVLDAPVSLAVDATVGADGRVDGGAVRATLGAGRAFFIDRPIAVDRGVFAASFDAPSGGLAVETLEVSAGANQVRLIGDVIIDARADRALPERVGFDLDIDVLTVDTLGRFVEPLSISDAELVGVYDVDPGVLRFDTFDAGLRGGRARGTLAFDFDRDADEPGAMGLAADLKLEGEFGPDDVLALWPTLGDTKGRDWFKDSIKGGVARNVGVKVDLAAGVFDPDLPMPDDSVRLSFDIADGVASPGEGLPLITGVDGAGVLSGNALRITAKRGEIAGVALSDGVLRLTRLRPVGGQGIYRARAVGDIVKGLKILDSEGLRLMTEAEIDPTDFGGRFDGIVEFRQPLLPDATQEDMTYTLTGRVIDGSLQDVWQGAPVTDVDADLEADIDGMTLTGTAELLGAPVDMVFEQAFEEKNAPTTISVTGEVDPAVADLFGLATRFVLDGPVRFASVGRGYDGVLTDLHVDADFSDSRFFIPGYFWRKPAGRPASGSIDIVFGKNNIEISKARVEADDVLVEATASLDEKLAVLGGHAPVIRVGDIIDGSLTVGRNAKTGRLDAVFDGERVSIGPVIAFLMDNPQEEEQTLGAGFDLKAKAETVVLRLGVKAKNAEVEMIHDGEILYSAHVKGNFENGEPLMGTLTTPNPQGVQQLTAWSSDSGAFLAGVFEAPSMKGGVIDVDAVLYDAWPGPPVIEGDAVIRNTAVVDAPILARIFSAGSLAALDQLLVGGGIAVRSATGRFKIHAGKFTIYDGAAQGPAIGITTRGEVDFLGDSVDLMGSVTPLYGVNSFLGKIPGVGGLFVNRKGEGLVSVQFAIDGTLGQQIVTVNPLSAATPGVLRRIFEPTP